jgi:hypothetical protein
MSFARLVRHALVVAAFGLSGVAGVRADEVVADPPWGWHAPTEELVVLGMFAIPIGALALCGLFAVLPALPPDGPVETDEAYEWGVTVIVSALLLVHVWALMPVFGVYLL